MCVDYPNKHQRARTAEELLKGKAKKVHQKEFLCCRREQRGRYNSIEGEGLMRIVRAAMEEPIGELEAGSDCDVLHFGLIPRLEEEESSHVKSPSLDGTLVIVERKNESGAATELPFYDHRPLRPPLLRHQFSALQLGEIGLLTSYSINYFWVSLINVLSTECGEASYPQRAISASEATEAWTSRETLRLCGARK